MDRAGVRQVPEGSGEQEKMVETGCEITCGSGIHDEMMMIEVWNKHKGFMN